MNEIINTSQCVNLSSPLKGTKADNKNYKSIVSAFLKHSTAIKTTMAGSVLIVASNLQAAPRIEQVVCNPANYGAIIRVWNVPSVPIPAGTGLSAVATPSAG